ncbi:hypothetical protein GJ698_25975 [Pseudoduganella sp. FT26W]|uniref:Beta-lactamase hydrolase-like protein phosphatase-like domain-containing protein n=1 Tax=Duganella aquatilis TaxID=2666082 RepID=A0A844DGS4_9BURK|nr:sulfur transferase domain-containing protein [Duganella aquatilis]MRW87524.1 hypothetical protein [Duganella aquatilis]
MKTFQLTNKVHVGAQPDHRDLAVLKEQGVRTVIDFRMPAETGDTNREVVMAAGMQYVNIAVDKHALSTLSLDQLQNQLQQDSGPYLLHCASGARASVMWALHQAREHEWSYLATLQAIQTMGTDVSQSPEFLSFIRDVTANHKHSNSAQ